MKTIREEFEAWFYSNHVKAGETVNLQMKAFMWVGFQASRSVGATVDFEKLAAWRNVVGRLFNDYGNSTGRHHVAGMQLWQEMQGILIGNGEAKIYDGVLPGNYASSAPASGEVEPVAYVSPALHGAKLTFEKPDPPEGWEDYADSWYCRPLVYADTQSQTAQQGSGPEGHVAIPKDVAAAKGMYLVGYSWLKHNAPQELATPQPEGDGWNVASSITGSLPEEGVPVIGYNPAWIDLDFNPKGIRECFRHGDGTEWLNAYWFDEQDCYERRDGAPTLWRYYPQPPKEGEGDE